MICRITRYLIKGRGRSWAEAMRVLTALKDANAESIRIMIVNYFAAALKSTKSEKEAVRLLQILECFSEPYPATDKDGPLLLSIAEALGLGHG